MKALVVHSFEPVVVAVAVNWMEMVPPGLTMFCPGLPQLGKLSLFMHLRKRIKPD